MRQVMLSEITEAINKIKELKNQTRAQGVLGIETWGVHLRLENFIAMFDEYIVKERGDDTYPWELVTEYNGVEFKALFDAQEAEQYGIQIQK